MSALDTQVDGTHYKTMAIQPMEFSMANGLDACQHTVIKYVTRFRAKGGIRDLEKAKHVIDMMIEFEARAQETNRALIGATTSVHGDS
jgi:deoxyribose-phosphate aldolase